MTICNDGHDEICYEGYGCPLCAMLDELLKRDDTVADLTNQLNEANSHICTGCNKELKDSELIRG